MELEDAKKVLEQAKKDRSDLCAAEIEAVLKVHRCHLEVGLLIKPDKTIPHLQIIALD